MTSHRLQASAIVLDVLFILPKHVALHAADLVFIQNGMLQPWLDARNLGHITQVSTRCNQLHANALISLSSKSPMSSMKCSGTSPYYTCMLACLAVLHFWRHQSFDVHSNWRTTSITKCLHVSVKYCINRKLILQALVYFAVSKKGETPIDGKTDANPEGLTAVTGKHAEAFAARLAAGNLSCKVSSGKLIHALP